MVCLQSSLFTLGDPEIDSQAGWERLELGGDAWVDVCRGWLRGADDLFESLAQGVAWRQRKRWMYERMVDEPRLTRWYRGSDVLPDERLDDIRSACGNRYGVPFGAVGLNYYRDGSDSVAFHRDRELRFLSDTIVAIVTLGAARPFLLRPVGGGGSRRIVPASGDLVVMGGTCQIGWEHAVPKVAAAGPRISASVRWSSRRGPLDRPGVAGVGHRRSPRAG